MVNFEKKATIALSTMKERHEKMLTEYKEELHVEAQLKPPIWSRDLLDLRNRQKVLANQENYSEAQKIKSITDSLEEEERKTMTSCFDNTLTHKERNCRKLQEVEKQALLKKIETQRRENNKKRQSDWRILLQRNKNIQISFKSTQVRFKFQQSL